MSTKYDLILSLVNTKMSIYASVLIVYSILRNFKKIKSLNLTRHIGV